jgi:hypothetical protein
MSLADPRLSPMLRRRRDLLGWTAIHRHLRGDSCSPTAARSKYGVPGASVVIDFFSFLTANRACAARGHAGPVRTRGR